MIVFLDGKPVECERLEFRQDVGNDIDLIFSWTQESGDLFIERVNNNGGKIIDKTQIDVFDMEKELFGNVLGVEHD